MAIAIATLPINSTKIWIDIDFQLCDVMLAVHYETERTIANMKCATLDCVLCSQFFIEIKKWIEIK